MATTPNVIRLPARAAVLQSVRRAINARAAAIHSSEATRTRAVNTAVAQLRDGASTGWAIQSGVRVLRGLPQVPR